MKKLFIVSNSDTGLVSFRKEVIEEILKHYKLHVLVPKGIYIDELKRMGCVVHETKVNRRGTNAFQDLKLYKEYKKAMKKEKPDVVLTYTIKPNIYGGLAAKRLKIPYIANITGLGTAVENKGILQKITLFLYKKAFKKINTVFFQNQENMDFFIDKKISNNKNYKLLPGSGVNLDKFKPLDYDFNTNDRVVITYLGRIMKNKGIGEMLEAIEILNNKNILFNITGTYEEEIYKEKIEVLVEKELLVYNEQVSNVIPIIKESQAIINPTYHEGMSNVLLEAAASARPVIASNIPGCREIFDDGVSGIAFEPKDADSIVEAVNKFLLLSVKERKEMGFKGREKVEKEFDRNIVVNAYLQEMNEILK